MIYKVKVFDANTFVMIFSYYLFLHIIMEFDLSLFDRDLSFDDSLFNSFCLFFSRMEKVF